MTGIIIKKMMYSLKLYLINIHHINNNNNIRIDANNNIRIDPNSNICNSNISNNNIRK